MAIKRKTHLNLSGSHHILDSDNGFVGGTLYITGALSASNGITSSIRYVDGASTPFLVNGGNMAGINYNGSTGQWEITGSSGTSVVGANTDVQFNADGVHGADTGKFTYNSASFGSLPAGTLSAPTGSFADIFVKTGSIKISENAQNSIEIYSSSIILGTPPFYIKPSDAPDAIDLYASSSNFNINGFNIVPLWNHATTSGNASNTVLSGSLLSDNMPQYGVGLLDINIIANDSSNTNQASWKFAVTLTGSGGTVDVVSTTELDNVLIGTNAQNWDVNFVGANIEVTSSSGPPFANKVYWMAKVINKMILSSSGQVIY